MKKQFLFTHARTIDTRMDAWGHVTIKHIGKHAIYNSNTLYFPITTDVEYYIFISAWFNGFIETIY